MSDTTVPPPPAPAGEDKTVAIISYITLIGFIIALIMHNGKKTQLGTFHLQQMLGLIVTAIAGGIAIMIVGFILAFIPVLGWILSILMNLGFMLGLLALMVIGVINAMNGQLKPLPVVGVQYQKWFGKAFV
jgi:uncharacterized membrane protein